MTIGKIEEALNKKADVRASQEFTDAWRRLDNLCGCSNKIAGLHLKEKSIGKDDLHNILRDRYLPALKEKRRGEAIQKFMSDHHRLREELVDLGIEVEEE